MSYCRWSSDWYTCDLYVYESQRGFETHVADRRVNVEPPRDDTSAGVIEALMAEARWYGSLHVDGELPEDLWLDLATIGPEAGQHYVDDTAVECAQRLRALKAKGFNVPDYAIANLEQEARGEE